jgi:hypothetical protein
VRLRRWATTAVAVLSVVAVAACGANAANNPSDGGSDDRGGAGASSTTSDTPAGAGASEVDALTAKTLGVAMAKAATDAGSAHMVMSGGSSMGNLTMTGDLGGMGQKLADQQLAMTMKIPGAGVGAGNAQMRIVDSALYVKIPGIGVGNKWLKVSLDDPNNPLGSVYGQLATLTDPNAIKASYSAFKKFTDLGDDTVDGVEARHYRVVVDVVKSLKASGLDDIGGLSLKDVLKSMPKQTTSDLWLDGDNHIVKMRSDTAMGAFEIHYSKWGKPVHVSAPPARRVVQLPY